MKKCKFAISTLAVLQCNNHNTKKFSSIQRFLIDFTNFFLVRVIFCFLRFAQCAVEISEFFIFTKKIFRENSKHCTLNWFSTNFTKFLRKIAGIEFRNFHALHQIYVYLRKISAHCIGIQKTCLVLSWVISGFFQIWEYLFIWNDL